MATVPGYSSSLQTISLCSFALIFFGTSEGQHPMLQQPPFHRAEWFEWRNDLSFSSKKTHLRLYYLDGLSHQLWVIWHWWCRNWKIISEILSFGVLPLLQLLGQLLLNTRTGHVGEGKDNRGRVYPASDMNHAAEQPFWKWKTWEWMLAIQFRGQASQS